MAKALTTFELACKAGHQESCLHLGALYIQGQGVQKDVEKGVAFDDVACSRDASSTACVVLGAVLVNGQNGVPKDSKRGIAILEKAAAGGNATADGRLGDALILTGSKDVKRILALYEQACAGMDPSSCQNAGAFYENGNGTNVDPKRAESLYASACTLHVESGCGAAKALAQKQLMHDALDARELWRSYEDNEIAADAKFKGKTFVTVGSVQAVTKDISDAAVIQLASPNEFEPISVYVRDDQMTTAATLHRHDKIYVNCACDGKFVTSVVLKNCEIVVPPQT